MKGLKTSFLNCCKMFHTKGVLVLYIIELEMEVLKWARISDWEPTSKIMLSTYSYEMGLNKSLSCNLQHDHNCNDFGEQPNLARCNLLSKIVWDHSYSMLKAQENMCYGLEGAKHITLTIKLIAHKSYLKTFGCPLVTLYTSITLHTTR
jgi:hypothetical protein